MLSCPRCLACFGGETRFCTIDGAPLVEHAIDPLIGTPIDRYMIEARIAAGGMGIVYRGRHSGTGRPCAVKVLRGEHGANKKTVERFRREALALGRLDHPNLVAVLDSGATAAGLAYVVMELVQGRTLKAMLAEEAPIDPARAAQIARQIAAGLAASHAAGLVHRDLKPGNVMLVQHAGGEHAKLLDFGLAAPEDRTHDEEDLTSSGVAIGTPAYMAPEQAQYSSVDAKADLYALGCVLYEMIAGRPPFVGDPRRVLVQHASEPAPELPHTRGLGPLVAWLLAKEPRDRPPSAQVVIQEIDRVLATSPSAIDAHDTISGFSAERAAPARSRRGLIIAGAIVLSGAAAGARWRPATQAPAPTLVEAPTKIAPPSEALAVTASIAPPSPRSTPARTPIAQRPARRADAGAPSPPEVVATPGLGTINVIVKRGGAIHARATLLVDGLVATPPPCRIELPSGTHVLEVRSTGARPIRREIEVHAGETTRLVFDVPELQP